MRYREISRLDETFLDTLRQTVGNKPAPTSVNNNGAALQVLYRIGSNPDYLDSITDFLVRMLHTRMTAMGDNALTRVAAQMFPNGHEFNDFLLALCLNCVMTVAERTAAPQGYTRNYVRPTPTQQAQQATQQQASDPLASIATKLPNVPRLLASVATGDGLTAILQMLGIGPEVYFDLLTRLNRKLIVAARVSAGTLMSGGI